MKIFLSDNEKVTVGLHIFAGFVEVADKLVVISGRAVTKCLTQIHFAAAFTWMFGGLIKKWAII